MRSGNQPKASVAALACLLAFWILPAGAGQYSDDELRIMYREVQARVGADRDDPVISVCLSRMRAGDENALAALFLWVQGRDLVLQLAGESASTVEKSSPGSLADRLMAQQKAREDAGFLRRLNSMQKGFLYCQQFLPESPAP